MRRKVGTIVGVCVAVALAGSAGAVLTTRQADAERSVGTWHDAPATIQAPTPAPVPPEPGPNSEHRTVLPESSPAGGRQRVGQLLPVGKLLGYATAVQPQTFHYPGASYVKLHFKRLTLLPGDYVTVSDPNG